MTTFTIARVDPTTYPFSVFLSELAASLPFIFQKTEETFCRVFVNKLDKQGNIRTIKVTEEFSTQEPSYIENRITGDLYFDEPASLIATKCAALALSILIYTALTMAWHAYQILRSIVIIALRLFEKMRTPLALHRCFEAIQILASEMKPLPEIIKERLWCIMSAPLFGVMIQLAALCGLIRPFHMREVIAVIEKAWHRGISHKEDMRHLPQAERPDCASFCKDIHSGREFYLAYCFQVRGNVAHPNIRVLRRVPL